MIFLVCRKKNNKILAVLNSFSYLCIKKAAFNFVEYRLRSA